MMIIMSDSDACTKMFFRSKIDDYRIINDTSSVVRMMIISDVPGCGIILMALEVSLIMVIFL